MLSTETVVYKKVVIQHFESKSFHGKKKAFKNFLKKFWKSGSGILLSSEIFTCWYNSFQEVLLLSEKSDA